MSRRDISNEIIVALSAIAMLALALTFGIVLTISNRPETPAPPTGQAVAAETQTQAFVLAQSASPDVASTTAAISRTLEAAQTSAAGPSVEPATAQRGSPSPVPTVTAATVRASPLPSETATETATDKATGTATEPLMQATAEVQILTTQTVAATRTAHTTNMRTPAQAASFAASPIRTQRATATASATLAPTRTASSTRKPSATFTRTPSPTPSQTPSATRTPSPTQTPSNTPTLTPTLIPTITTAISFSAPSPTLSFPTPLPGALQTIQAPPCIPRSGWSPYVIQQGDTLFSIAQQAGISLGELQAASCVADASRIVAGQVVLVPPGAIVALRTSLGTSLPTPPPLPGVNARDCGNPAARIISPVPGAVLTGPFTVIGAANVPDFSFFKLEMRPDDGGQNWNNVGTVFSAVEGGVLGRVDTSFFPAGIYWLQLTVVQTDSNYPPPCAIRIIINK